MKPSTAAVIEELRSRGPFGLTQLQALDAIGCFRLAARVMEARAEGYDITSEPLRTTTGKHVTRYVLHEKPEQMAAFG